MTPQEPRWWLQLPLHGADSFLHPHSILHPTPPCTPAPEPFSQQEQTRGTGGPGTTGLVILLLAVPRPR